jgi:hypothetical protein
MGRVKFGPRLTIKKYSALGIKLRYEDFGGAAFFINLRARSHLWL